MAVQNYLNTKMCKAYLYYRIKNKVLKQVYIHMQHVASSSLMSYNFTFCNN